MTAPKARRGRPKGSGIDDQQRLIAIARVMTADPRLKTTTAIKAIGITDPSAIRRLRDKFNATTAEGQPSRRPASATSAQSAAGRAAALIANEPIRRASAVLPQPAPPRMGTAADVAASSKGVVKPANNDTIPVAATLFGMGLNAATAMLEQHMLLAQSVMKLPQVRDLMRNQIAFTEFMLTVANPSPGHRFAH
jgi:hypothetical protein